MTSLCEDGDKPSDLLKAEDFFVAGGDWTLPNEDRSPLSYYYYYYYYYHYHHHRHHHHHQQQHYLLYAGYLYIYS